MRSLDFTPLFRSTVGFDRLTDLVETAMRSEESTPNYPPYNIERTGEDTYRVTMAVAGFAEDDIDITVKENTLTIAGRLPKAEKAGEYLHRGIAGRPFERRFELASHIRVNDASLQNGLLHVSLVREIPEAMKPRTVKINGAQVSQPQVLEQKAA